MKALTLLALFLSACAPQSRDSAQNPALCSALFQKYDRIVLDEIDGAQASTRALGDRERGSDRTIRTVKKLRMNNCHSVFVANSKDFGRYAFEGVENLRGPSFLHVGLFDAPSGVETLFANLGYRTRIIEIESYGQRVFVGPLYSNQAERAALKIAKSSGLRIIYPVSRLPWSR